MSSALKVRILFLLVIPAFVVALFALRSGKAPRVKRHYDPWVITTTDLTNNNGTYLGNGYIGARFRSEGWGHTPEQKITFYVAGLYDNETLLPLGQSSLRMLLQDGRTARSMTRNPRLPYRQTLDMRRGVLRTQCSMNYGRKTVDVDISTRVSRVRQGIVVSTVSLTPRRDCNVKLIRRNTWLGPQQHSRRETKVAWFGSLQPPKSLLKDTEMRKGRRYTYVDYMAVAETGRFGDPQQKALVALRSARAIGAAKLIAEHEEAWRKLWASDIKIEGDPEAQQVVHSCMFYLLQSVRKGGDWSVPPTGLSNTAWNGHVFWDADTWMFPVLLPQYPELARQILDYRYKTLTGARANARKRGLSGVEFAWESARTGRESIGMPFSEERHVTADVALAQWQYYLATGDKQWLRRRAYPILVETAYYWTSRVRYNKSADRYEIHRVVPPDEIAEIVDNSVYTNAAAKRNLEIAAQARRELGRLAPYRWSLIAGKMYLPFDRKNRRYIEYDSYSGSVTKQADTELLIYPLRYPMPRDVMVNMFDYYKAKVHPKGPAMSSSVHSVIAAQLGRRDEAYEHFRKSYRSYLREPFNLFNEKPSKYIDNTCFLTGSGGTLQAVIYGFGGLRTDSKTLSASPILPKKWKRLSITGIKWRGHTYDLTVDREGYRLRKVNPAITSKNKPKVRRSVQSAN